MDVRQYVKVRDVSDLFVCWQFVSVLLSLARQVKTIPGGRISESSYVDGMVLRKNLAHKKMRRRIRAPRILLLSCGIEFERVGNRLSSLETLLTQVGCVLAAQHD